MRAYTHMAFQYGMLMQLSIMLLAVLVPAATSVVATTRASARHGEEENETAIALPGCKDKCGDVTIPYPFGIGDPRCYSRPEFEITCIESNNNEPTLPRLMQTRIYVTNISLEEAQLYILQLVNRDCYDDQGKPIPKEDQRSGGLRVYNPYTISAEKNRLFVVGCDTYAELVGSRGNQRYTTGCISKCDKIPGDYADSADENDTCSGKGCCRTKIPPLLNDLTLTVGSYYNHTEVNHFNPCGYAFVVLKDNFTFSNTSFQQLRKSKTLRLPLVLDWQIGETDCKYAREKGTYACKGNNSDCHEKPTGYICVCNKGFQGNPYLHDCQDIDECATSNATLCEHGKCKNIPGNYTCECDSGYQIVDNIKCIKVPNAKRLKISLGVSLSFSVLVVAILWIYRKNKKNQVEYLRRKYFKENGGERLKEKLGKKARIFTESEIMVATSNYTKKKLGQGRYGIVYKAVLDKQEVAIKKPQIDDQKKNTDTDPTAPKKITGAPTDQKQITPQDQFVNEMTVLYQINHNNVVRLVGCCLETKPPILVYEFIRNGSLYTRIHGKEGENPPPPLPLATRLKIAAETAGALAYLHNDSVIKIIHRDVKTANILLDDYLTPKLSGFGASSLLVPEDENQNSTLVRRSVGYVDPEYLESKKPLTEKSDVYSFGAVLAELLTGRKAGEEAGADEKIVEGPHEEIVRKAANLERGMLDQILDKKIVEEHLDEEIVRKAADLAKSCLKSTGEERPSMRQVATQLQLLVAPHPSGGGEAKDTGTSAECESSKQKMPLGDGQ